MIITLIKHSPLFTCPIIPIVLAYIAGLVAGSIWLVRFEILAAIALAVMTAGLYFLFRAQRTLAAFTLFAGIVLAGASATNHLVNPDLPPHHVSSWANNHRFTAEGFLYRPAEFSEDTARLYVKAQWIWANGRRYPATGNILLTVQNVSGNFLHNDRILFAAQLRKPRNFGNPGSFDYVRWLALQEIYVTAWVFRDKDIVRLGAHQRFPWLRAVDRFRAHARRAIAATTSEPSSMLLSALLLGDRKAIPENLQDSFTRSGTAHLLAISGLHIGVVAAFCYWAFLWLLSRSTRLLLRGNVPKIAAFLSLFPIFFYTLVAGAGLSAQRAFLMAAVYVTALQLNRENQLYNALGLAAFIILALQPAALWSISFQLSFVAVFGIIFVSPLLLSLFAPRDDLLELARPLLWRKVRDRALALFTVSSSAIFATAPLVAYHFSFISYAGLVANAILVPIVSVGVVPTGLAGVAVLPLSYSAAAVLFKISSGLVTVAASLAGFFSQLPGSSFQVPTPTISEVVLIYAFVSCLLLWRFYRVSGVAVLAALILLLGTCAYRHQQLSPSGFQATFLDVGQGDATFIHFPAGATMLIDGGGFFHHNFDTGKNIVAPFLLKSRITRIDYLVMTHPHPDHYDGLRYIAQHFRPREFWTNGDTVDDPFFVELQRTLASKNILVRTLNAESPPFTIDGVTLRILHPTAAFARHCSPTEKQGLNNRSLVTKLNYKDVAILFTGDIQAPAEQSLLVSEESLSAQVVKVAHHGSSTSSTLAFIAAVSPGIAVCPVGHGNRFQLPHKDIVARYCNHGAAFHRTDQDGAISVTTDGKMIRVRKGRGKKREEGLYGGGFLRRLGTSVGFETTLWEHLGPVHCGSGFQSLPQKYSRRTRRTS